MTMSEQELSRNIPEFYGKKLRAKVSDALTTSHNIIFDITRIIKESLRDVLQSSRLNREETDNLLSVVIANTFFAADEVGRDLGEVARGTLLGIIKTAKELHLDVNELIGSAALAMLMESDWRDIDLRIVIESTIKKSVPDGKDLLRKIFHSEEAPEGFRKAA